MVANIYTLEVFNSIPINWKGKFGYNQRDTQEHISDGWRDLIVPELAINETLGEWSYDSELDVCTYAVVTLTEDEVKGKLISEANEQKEQLIQQKLRQQVIEDAQLIEDDTEALNNAALYPFWESDIDVFEGHKYQHITDNEFRLYRCEQSHTTQSNWQPQDVPALFTRVGFEDEILAWVQPTGSQDAYKTGDKVHFPTKNDAVYESTIDNNVWSPITYPAGWQLIE